MIQLKNGGFPSSLLHLLVTKELALFAMVVKRHFSPQILLILARKVKAFYSIPLNVFYENLSDPKYKSLKIFGH